MIDFFSLVWAVFSSFHDRKIFIISHTFLILPCLLLDNLYSYKYSWTLFCDAVRLLGNSLILLVLFLNFIRWDYSSSQSRLIIPYQRQTFLTIPTNASWVMKNSSLAGNFRYSFQLYESTGYCYLLSVPVILTFDLGSFPISICWSVFCLICGGLFHEVWSALFSGIPSWEF